MVQGMTMFEFMVNALYLLAGVVCVAMALLVIYAVAVTVYRGISGGRKDGKR